MNSSLLKFLVIIMILVILFFISPLMIWVGTSWFKILTANTGKHKAEVLKYLNDTYHEEFVISHSEYKEMNDMFRMRAYPKSKKQLAFNVVVFKLPKNLSEIRDDYAPRKKYRDLIRNIFEEQNYLIDIMYDFPDIYDPPRTNERSWKERSERQTIKVKVFSSKIINEDMKREEAEKGYRLINNFKDIGVRLTVFGSFYFDPTSDIKEELFKSFLSKNAYEMENDFYSKEIAVYSFQTKDITSVDDVLSHFKLIKH